MRKSSGLALAGACLSLVMLSGCTLLGSGVAIAPPGIDAYAFRECLLDRGFYAPPAFSGTARDDLALRHAETPPSRQDLLTQSSAAFVARAASTIANGLMPALEFDADADDSANAPYAMLPGTRKGLTDWRLNRFLDCYIGPVGAASSTAGAQDSDTEGRLLRAHILLVLLAKYGTEMVISHAGTRQVAQAEMLLDHVVAAERALRSASAIVTPQAEPADGQLTITDPAGLAQPSLRWRQYATRLLRILQIGVDDERIDAGQSIERASNLVAAFEGNTAGFLPLLKDGFAGAITAQEVRLYGDAYLRDARETLAMTRGATTADGRSFTYRVATFQQAWKNWDAELAHACRTLASVAKRDDTNCLPATSPS